MNKKRNLIFGIAVAVAWITVITLSAIFLVPMLLENLPGRVDSEQAQETVQLALEGVISGGTEEPVLLGADGTAVPISPATGIAGLISKKLEYEVLSVETEGDTGMAQLKITAPDTVALVRQALADMENYDESQLTERMNQLLKNHFATVEYTVELELAKVESQWCIVPNAQFSDAITGGMISRYQQLQLAIMDALAGGGEG